MARFRKGKKAYRKMLQGKSSINIKCFRLLYSYMNFKKHKYRELFLTMDVNKRFKKLIKAQMP